MVVEDWLDEEWPEARAGAAEAEEVAGVTLAEGVPYCGCEACPQPERV